MFDVALRASLILIGAWLTTLALRRATAATRHLVWHGAFVAIVLAPVVSPLTPRISVPEPALARDIVRTLTSFSGRTPLAHGSPLGQAAISPAGTSSRTTSDESAAGFADAAAIVTLVWATGSIAVALWFAIGWIASALTARRAAAADPGWQIEVSDLCQRLRLQRDVRVRMLAEHRSPIAVGLRTPVILLPLAARRWTAERRRSVFLHELAHVRRADCRVQALAHVACALYWFNPLVWLASARLASERERACDDVVLRCGAQPSAYATDLLEIARDLRPALRPTAALAMARPSELEGRLLAVLAAGRARVPAPQSRWIVAALLSVLTVVALGASPSTPAIAAASRSVTTAPAVRNAPTPEMPAAERQAADARRAQATRTLEASGDHDAREHAVLDLAASGHQDSIAPLVAALDDSSQDIREKAALGLALMSGPDVVPPLLKALADGDAQVREKAAIGLALRHDVQVTDALLAASTDTDPQVREKIALALGTSGDQRAEPALRTMLADSDAQVREKAAAGLALLNNPAAGIAAGERIRDGVRGAIGLLLNLSR